MYCLLNNCGISTQTDDKERNVYCLLNNWGIRRKKCMYCLLNNCGIRTQTDNKERNVCILFVKIHKILFQDVLPEENW